MRKITFESKKVITLLDEVEKLNKEINKFIDDWKKVDEYVGKLNLKVERCKEKIRPIVADQIKARIELGEFELVGSTKKNGNLVEVEIHDQIEMIKEQLRKEKNAKKEENTKKS
jgi:hypothetical protein